MLYIFPIPSFWCHIGTLSSTFPSEPFQRVFILFSTLHSLSLVGYSFFLWLIHNCSRLFYCVSYISSLLFRLILYPSVNLRFVRLNIGLDKLRFFRLILLSCDCCATRSQPKPDLTAPFDVSSNISASSGRGEVNLPPFDSSRQAGSNGGIHILL